MRGERSPRGGGSTTKGGLTRAWGIEHPWSLYMLPRLSLTYNRADLGTGHNVNTRMGVLALRASQCLLKEVGKPLGYGSGLVLQLLPRSQIDSHDSRNGAWNRGQHLTVRELLEAA